MDRDSDCLVFHAVRDSTATGCPGAPIRSEGDTRASFGHRVSRCDDPKVDGAWCDWGCDGLRPEILRCRYGLYPLFLAARPGEICIFNRLSEILRRRAQWIHLDEWAALRYTLSGRDAAASVWPVRRRRLFHTRLALDFARLLLTRGFEDIRTGALIARLGRLAGRAKTDGYWFSTERIQWLAVGRRALELALGDPQPSLLPIGPAR